MDAAAQYSISPNVIVDESVLDELGPQPNLPGMMREGDNYYRSPPHYSGPGYRQGAPKRLLPAPRNMPQSQVTAPRQLLRLAPSSRAKLRQSVVPRRKMAKGPGVLGQIKQSEVDNLGRSPAPPPTTPTIVRKEAAPPPRVPVPLVSKADRSSLIVPALPNSVEPPSKTPQVVVPPTTASGARVPPLPAISPPATPKVTVPPAPAISPPTTPKVTVPPAPAISPPATPKVTVPPAPPIAPSSSQRAALPRATAPSVSSGVPSSPRVAPPQGGKAMQPQIASLPANLPPASVGPDGHRVTINFAKGVTDMPPGTAPFLSDLIKKMKSNQTMRLQLRGYAGSTKGSPSQARRISLFRALSVRTYLMKQGIRSTRMDVRALGNKVKEGTLDRVDVEVKD